MGVVESLFKRFAGLELATYIFSGELCEIYKKFFFIKHIWPVTSVKV